MLEIVLAILGGLVLFLFAVGSLSDVISQMAGEKARQWIVKFTSSTFSATEEYSPLSFFSPMI